MTCWGNYLFISTPPPTFPFLPSLSISLLHSGHEGGGRAQRSLQLGWGLSHISFSPLSAMGMCLRGCSDPLYALCALPHSCSCSSPLAFHPKGAERWEWGKNPPAFPMEASKKGAQGGCRRDGKWPWDVGTFQAAAALSLCPMS